MKIYDIIWSGANADKLAAMVILEKPVFELFVDIGEWFNINIFRMFGAGPTSQYLITVSNIVG